jgi:DNA-binding response OmpR family regulator/signal transduction histidine kinase
MANSGDRAVARPRPASDAGPAGDRILLVEADPVVSDLIGRQALQSVGYQVQIATDAASAISRALQWGPDLILIDLHLPGLSGKDLMVALASQGIQTPLIIIAQRGAEADIIQTFRLGAADYLVLPVREAEVINAANRVLKQVHERRERDRLAQQLQQANQELQLRVRELTTIFALGRAMTSITDQADLLDKILDAAIRTTQADLGWFLLREDANRPFILAAEQKLPAALGARVNQAWDDGISSLVAMSGEMLAIHGEALRRFMISSLGLAALIVPIKTQKTVLGLLVLMRQRAVPFGASEQHLLDALADYASISLVNARLVRALEERARVHQQAAGISQLVGKVNNEVLRVVKEEVAMPLARVLTMLDALAKDPASRLRPDQRQQLAAARDELLRTHQAASAIAPVQAPRGPLERTRVNLNEALTQALRRMLPFAQAAGISFVPALPTQPVSVCGDAGLLAHAFEGLLSNVLRLCGSGVLLEIRLGQAAEDQAHLVIRMGGRSIPPKDAEKLFEEAGFAMLKKVTGRLTGPPGISLSLAREILALHNGRVWVSSQAGKGTDFHVAIPLAPDTAQAAIN